MVRMKDDRLPKQLFYEEVFGKRPQEQDKPEKCFKDSLKDNLKGLHIDVKNWKGLTMNRTEWRNAVKKGCCTFEAERIKHAEIKRGLGKHGNTANYLPFYKLGGVMFVSCQR